MNKHSKHWILAILLLAFLLPVVSVSTEVKAEEDIINIGMTDPISSLNPILMDATEVMLYATSIAYDPLVSLNQDLEMVNVLAEDVSTEDNQSFTVTLREDAAWSDGEPITADDVIFTVKKTTSRDLANPSQSTWAVIEGFGEDGFIDEDAGDIPGMIKEDDRTVVFKTKHPMPLVSFENTFLRYLFPVPYHILGDKDTNTLKTDPWFLAPEVVSGPYFPTSFDSNHYVTYEANENYWRGAPEIEKVNIQILQASQMLTALQSGEIDLVQQTTATIPQADYEAIEALDNIEVHYGQPVTNQLTFINTEKIDDVKVRQAILYAIDRDLLLEQLLRGKGEVTDGFTTSASPYYDDSFEVLPYDPDKARSLLEESGWDSSQTLLYKINSGDPTLVQGVNVIAQQLADVGIQVDIQTLDIGNLLIDAAAGDYDLFTVQYTLAPVDPYPDMMWLVGGEEGDNWPRYHNDELSELIEDTQATEEVDELVDIYRQIDELLQEEVPVLSTYVISGLGAVSKRLENAVPDVYGTFLNMHEWTVAE